MTNKMLKVLLVGPMPIPPYTGGIGSFVNAFLNSRPAKNIRVTLINTGLPRDSRGRLFPRFLLSIRFFMALTVRLLTSRYHLAHIHCSAYDSFLEKSLMLLLCSLRGLPAVIHIHSGSFPDFFHRTSLKRYVVYVLNRALAVFAVSKAGGDFFRSICQSPVYLVPNCVHPRFFSVGERESNVSELLFVGHIDRRKGVFDLFRAVQLLRSRGFENRVVLAGGELHPGALEHARRSASEAGIGNLDLPGEVCPEALLELYRRAKIFVLPSHVEGLPIALLEAMTTGLPVVATKVGGIPDVVEDGLSGFLVPPEDPEALADKIIRLIEDPELCRQMGETGKRIVLQNHHADHVAEGIIQIYRQLLLRS